MVRRWSSINNLIISLLNYKNYNIRTDLTLFKSAVYLKRFIYKKTKYRRKPLARRKHKNNWTIYLNIIKYWPKDLQYNKQLTRYQFFKNFLPNPLIVYNFNYIKPRHSLAFATKNNVFTNAVSQKFYSLFSNRKFVFIKSFYKSNNFVMTYFAKKDDNKTNPNIQPLYLYYDSLLYPFNSKNNFGCLNIFLLLYDLNIKHTKEIYKIISLLFYFILKR